MVFFYFKFVFIFKDGKYFCSFERLGEDPCCNGTDLFIKLDSIGARTLMLDLRIIVGIFIIPANTVAEAEAVALLKVGNYFSYLRN